MPAAEDPAHRGPLYFGVVSHVGECLRHLEERKPGQKHLLLLGRSMNFVDVAGAELLAQESRRRRTRCGALWFHGLREGATTMLSKEPFASDIGGEACFAGKRAAIAGIYARLDKGVSANCRARLFEECGAAANAGPADAPKKVPLGDRRADRQMPAGKAFG